MRNMILALAVLALAAPAMPQDGDAGRRARVRHLEGGVTLQRADEGVSEEAAPNLPYLSGDRLWTDSGGRVELQFEDGSVVRLDRASKLEHLGGSANAALRLWAGSLFLRTSGDASSFAIETPAGVVETLSRGVYRVDVEAGETRLSVYEGEAALDAGRRRVGVGSGERAWARLGEPPQGPRRFDARDRDDFALWEEERQQRTAWAGDSGRYLPNEVLPYAGELESNGAWYYEAEVGHVWRPYVAAGWSPYSNGRWVWTWYGWTWVPYETWGWAPSHFGRWGWSPALAWYWIPGSVWGPAWVHWAVGSSHVAWCPLGWRDRPIQVYDRRARGYAVPKVSPQLDWAAPDVASSRAWQVVRKVDLASRDLARARVQATPSDIKDVRVLETARQRPVRDFRVADVEVGSLVREGKSKPTIGDFVPELRHDPRTVIPHTRTREPSQPRSVWESVRETPLQQTRPRDEGMDRSDRVTTPVEPRRSAQPERRMAPEPEPRRYAEPERRVAPTEPRRYAEPERRVAPTEPRRERELERQPTAPSRREGSSTPSARPRAEAPETRAPRTVAPPPQQRQAPPPPAQAKPKDRDKRQ
jgi:hypothetical protein